MAALIYVYTNKACGFSTPSPALVSFPFGHSHSHRYEMVSHSDFDLHFPDVKGVEHLYMYLLAICLSCLKTYLLRTSTLLNQVALILSI